uniref:Uncharacterized protein n=1 Tax=Streptomyces avermitilis TaxID=33903 RepID=A0A499VDV6_STRAX|nr:hypothetical protein SAVMC3_51330 [Streptomyces avermitilis]
MLYGIIAATSALLLASALAAVLRVPALRLGLVERRRGRTVSRLGGAAVVVGTVVVAGVGDWSGVARLGTGVGELLVVGAGVGALGLVADLRPVPGSCGWPGRPPPPRPSSRTTNSAPARGCSRPPGSSS